MKQWTQTSWFRLLAAGLMVFGMLSLLSGVWGGLLRLGLAAPLPVKHANWITYHGALMVSGFLGTLIGVERAVGLQRGSVFLAPLATGTGAVLILAGWTGPLPLLLFWVGSLIYLTAAIVVWRRHRQTYLAVMTLAAAAWTGGNILLSGGFPVARVVLWWGVFLGLTIVGERLELSRFQRRNRWSGPALAAASAITLSSLGIGLLHPTAGERLFGAGLVGLAVWLVSFDLARHTVRTTGLPRFTAVCLLAGYVWLAVAGVLMLVAAPLASGSSYDAAWHAFFLGFVFSMIFGHAPVIFPAVLRIPIPFARRFYLHVALMHFGLAIRFGADLTGSIEWRQWGGILNAAAIGLFLLNTVSAVAAARWSGGIPNHQNTEVGLSTVTCRISPSP